MKRSRFASAAAHLRPGEWTSYGDIAAAAGLPRAARMVGREAANSEDFPFAHRVLRSDGSIARGVPGRVELVRTMLEEEGITFSSAGKADPAARVYWDELRRRAGKTARA